MGNRAYQLEARRICNMLLNNSRHPVYLAPCGTGKTYTAAALIDDRNSLNRRVYVIVPQMEIFAEWMKVLSEHGLNPGYINDEGVRGKGRMVYVCMALSLINQLGYIQESIYPDEIITDECVTGDTMVDTEFGPIRIDEWTQHNPKYILTYDGVRKKYSRVVQFIPRGKRDIIEITTESGRRLRCTHDHLIYGEHGWQTAGTLTSKDEIFVNADVANEQSETRKDIRRFGYQVTGHTRTGPNQNGERYIKRYLTKHRYANADAVKMHFRDVGSLNHIEKCEARADTINIGKGTTSTNQDGMPFYPMRKSGKSLAHCLAIRVLVSPQHVANLRALRGLMGCLNENGPNTRPQTYQLSDLKPVSPQMLDMARLQLLGALGVFRSYCRYMNYSSRAGKSELQSKLLTGSQSKGWRGGSAMTDRVFQIWSISTHTAIAMMRTVLLKISFKIATGLAISERKKGKTSFLSVFALRLRESFSTKSKDSFRSACNTKYERIIGISKRDVQQVYDVEVETNHCYFTNGILSHNCQHALASSWESIYRYFPNALRLGLTATLYHGSLRSFEHLYTDVVQTISKSQAIEQGFITKPLLVLPEQWCQNVPKNGDDFDTKAQAEILGAPTIVGNVVDYYTRTFEGRPVIVPCATYEHAKMMTEAFAEKGWHFEHLHSNLAKHERKRILRAVAAGKNNGICTVGIGIEGMSIHGLYGVLWLRRTLSPIIWTQFNGRAERVVEGKDFYICADFVGNSVIHGMPDRDFVWSLEGDGGDDAPEPVVDLDPMQMCGRCGVMNAAQNVTCHFCGAVLGDDAEGKHMQRFLPAMVDGRLVAVRSDGQAAEIEAKVMSVQQKQIDERRKAESTRPITAPEKAAVLHAELFKGNRRKLFTEAVENFL